MVQQYEAPLKQWEEELNRNLQQLMSTSDVLGI